MNCYDSMISRDTSSTVKLLSFRDWKNKISLAEGHYLGTYLDEEGAFSPGPLLKLFTLANGIFIWIVVSFFQTQLTKKFWPQYWIFFVQKPLWNYSISRVQNPKPKNSKKKHCALADTSTIVPILKECHLLYSAITP